MTDSSEKEFKQIGYVHSEQGVRGEIFVSLLSEDAPWMDEWTTLSIGPQEESGPSDHLTIINKRPHKKQGRFGVIVQLEGHGNRNDVTAYKSWSVWLPSELLISEPGEAIFMHEVLGFRVFDQKRGEVGEIVAVDSNGMQDLIQIKTASGVYDVPFVEAFIVELNFDTSELHMDIPEGLLEVE